MSFIASRLNSDKSEYNEIVRLQLAELRQEESAEDLAEDDNAEQIADEGSVEKTDEENGKLGKKRWHTGLMGIGAHLQDRNVFALEVLPNSYIQFTRLLVYIIFIFMFIFTNFVDLRDVDGDDIPFFTRVNDTSICYKKLPDDPCLPDPFLTSEQAALLSNTIIVADGINASQWDGDGAVEGTDSFSTFQYFGMFISDPSVLEKSANPELHTIWDNITSVIWAGQRESQHRKSNSITVELRFIRTGGSQWPELSDDETMSVSIQQYACVRGYDCDNVKNWRWMVITNKETPIKRKESGTVYSSKLYHYAYFLGDIVVDSEALRIVTSSDPGGAVSACLAQEFCVPYIDYVDTSNSIDIDAFFKLILFVIFLACYVVWIVHLTAHVGNPKKWGKENLWLLVIASGVILQFGIGHIALEFMGLYSDNYKFEEGVECANIVISYFGFTMVAFGLFCVNDGPRRFITDLKQFYIAKLVYAVIYFSFATTYAIYRFPRVSGLDQPGTDTCIGRLGYTTSLESWSTKDKRIIVGLMIILYSIYFIGLAWFVRINFQTRRVLKELPYGMTRPTQISYSIFTWAIRLFIIVEIISSIIQMVDVEDSWSSEGGLSDFLLTLDSLIFVNIIWYPTHFLYICVIILMYMHMFLPPSESQKRNARTHYKTETELRDIQKNTTEASDIEEFVVLDRARLLCVCSREAYLPFDEKERDQFSKNVGEEDDLIKEPARVNIVLAFLRTRIKLEDNDDKECMEDSHNSHSKSEESQGYTKLSTNHVKRGHEQSDNTIDSIKSEGSDEHIELIRCMNDIHSSSSNSDISDGKQDGDHQCIKEGRRSAKSVKSITIKSEENEANSDKLELQDDDYIEYDESIHLKTRDRRVKKWRDSFVLDSQATSNTMVRIAGSPPSHGLYLNRKTGCSHSMGCRLIAHISEPEQASFHDTKCIILRQELSGDLIVAFRGTKTKKQVKTDLMLSRIAVDLDKFLAVTHFRKHKYLKAHGLLDVVSLDAMLEKLSRGETMDIPKLSALLPRAEMNPLPDYLQNACKDDSDIHGVGKIHFGFWSSYNRVRKDIHRVVREELLRQPGRVLVTGHSLGGALGILCAYDVCRWIIPTVKQELHKNFSSDQQAADAIKLSCYTFGSPKVGCRKFSKAFNKLVPNTFRIVCDGDVITANPPVYLGYRHLGIESVFDKSGSIVVNPSKIEKKFGFRKRMNPLSHMLTNYAKLIKSAYVQVNDEENLLKIMRIAYKKSIVRVFFMELIDKLKLRCKK